LDRVADVLGFSEAKRKSVKAAFFESVAN